MFVVLGAQLTWYANLLTVVAGCTPGVYCLYILVVKGFSLIYGAWIAGHSMLWIIPVLVFSVFIVTLAPIYRARLFKPLRQII